MQLPHFGQRGEERGDDGREGPQDRGICPSALTPLHTEPWKSLAQHTLPEMLGILGIFS